MLHGITGHARTWDDEARLLAARYRVLALDQRGHGDSDPAPDADYSDAALLGDLEAFVGRARPRPVSLVGAVARAAGWPSTTPAIIRARVERLVVVDIGPEIAPSRPRPRRQLMATAPERFETVDDVVAHMRANAPLYSEALLRQRAEHAVRPLPGGGFTWKYDRALRDAIRQGRMRVPADLWPQWRAIACPTLLVRGAAVRHAVGGNRQADGRRAAGGAAGRRAGRRPHRPRRSAGRSSSRSCASSSCHEPRRRHRRPGVRGRVGHRPPALHRTRAGGGGGHAGLGRRRSWPSAC